MAISYVGGQTGNRTGNSNVALSVTFNFTGGSNTTPSAGDLIVVSIASGTQARNPSLSIGTPTGYTNLTQLNPNATTYDTSFIVAYKIMGSTPDTAVTIPAQGNAADAQAYVIQCFRGVDAATPMDVAAVSASGTGTGRPDPASISPSTAGAWVTVHGGGAAATGATYTGPANYTTNFMTATGADTNDAMVGAGYRSDWTSGAEDPAGFTGGTTGANDSWAAYTLALRPASDHRTAAPGSLAVVVTTLDPIAKSEVFIGVGSTSLAFSTLAPDVLVSVTATPDAQAAAITGNSPTFIATNNTAVAPGQAALSLSGSEPIPSTSGSPVIPVPTAGVAFDSSWSTTDKHSDIVLSNSDRTIDSNAASAWCAVRGKAGKSTGKWYFEIKVNVASGSQFLIGLADADTSLSTNLYLGSFNHSYGWGTTGSFTYATGTGTIHGGVSAGADDVIGFAFDADAHRVEIYKNGVHVPAAYLSGMESGIFYPAASLADTTQQATISTRPVDLAYSPPDGYSAWEADRPTVTAAGQAPSFYTLPSPVPSSTRWRLWINGSNTGTDLQITEIEMHASVGGADECSGGTATASSEYGAGYEASKAFDNSTASRWLPSAGSGQLPCWIEYQFASAKQIIEYSIDCLSAADFPNNTPRQWWLQYYDGAKWVSLDHQKDQGSWGSTETRTFVVNAASPPLDLCYSGTPASSSEFSSAYADDNAFNGTLNYYPWAANTSTGWLEYDHGTGFAWVVESYKVQAKISADADSAPKTWTLEYFDGSTWQVVDTQTNVAAWSLGEARTYTISNSIAAQRWRINVSANQGNAYVQIQRLHLYGRVSDSKSIPVGQASVSITGAAPSPAIATIIPVGATAAAITTLVPSTKFDLVVSPGAAAAAIATLAPTTSVSDIKVIGAGASALLLTTSQPSALEQRNFYPGAQALQISGYSVVQAGQIIIDLLSTSLSITGQDPASLIAHAAAPGSCATTITPYQPTGLATDNRYSAPGAGALVATTNAPTVIAADNRAFSPAATALTMLGLAPTAAVSSTQSAAPSAGSLTLSALAPTIVTHVVALPSSRALTITTNAPSTSGALQADPEPDVLVLTGAAPTALATQNVFAVPPAGTVTLTQYAPSLTGEAILYPDRDELLLTPLAPTIKQSVSIGVGAGSLAITGYAPSIKVEHIIPIGFDELLLTGIAPTLLQAIVVQPGSDTLLLSTSAPVVARTERHYAYPDSTAVVASGLAPIRILSGMTGGDEYNLVIGGQPPGVVVDTHLVIIGSIPYIGIGQLGNMVARTSIYAAAGSEKPDITCAISATFR